MPSFNRINHTESFVDSVSPNISADDRYFRDSCCCSSDGNGSKIHLYLSDSLDAEIEALFSALLRVSLFIFLVISAIACYNKYNKLHLSSRQWLLRSIRSTVIASFCMENGICTRKLVCLSNDFTGVLIPKLIMKERKSHLTLLNRYICICIIFLRRRKKNVLSCDGTLLDIKEANWLHTTSRSHFLHCRTRVVF